MITINNELELNIDDLKFTGFAPEDVLFFDIETTGFAAGRSILYLIGCIFYQQNHWISMQFFGKNADDEVDLLKSFFDLASRHKALICYNGLGFDIPYLRQKAAKYELFPENEPDIFDSRIIVDIYKSIYKLRDFLNTENLKQKSMEIFLGINREDKYSGGELINYFHKYQKNNSKEIFDMLLLHNRDDICGMTNLLSLLSYSEAVNGNFRIDSIARNMLKNADNSTITEIVINGKLTYPVPKRVFLSNSTFNITLHKDTILLKVRAYTNELKYFYPNYKDYYYIPLEDQAIHKSVAFYVDKNFRTKAKAANCYSKKTGVFLPQFEEIVCPYFKIDYYDSTIYFEFTDEFKNDNELIHKYFVHVIQHLT